MFGTVLPSSLLPNNSNSNDIDPFEGFVCRLKRTILDQGKRKEEQLTSHTLWGQPPDFWNANGEQNLSGLPESCNQTDSTGQVSWGQPPICCSDSIHPLLLNEQISFALDFDRPSSSSAVPTPTDILPNKFEEKRKEKNGFKPSNERTTSSDQRSRARNIPIKFRASDSELKILLPKNDDVMPIYQIAYQKLAHGYNAGNAARALDRFIQRGLISVDASKVMKAEPESDHWRCSYYICVKLVTVPSTGASRVRFEGRGMDQGEAERNCNLAILSELYDFDVIKEANVEIYNPQRKDLLDPTRKLDLKTLAWLDCSTDKFQEKIKQIADRNELFY